MSVASATLIAAQPVRAETVTIGIGTQDTDDQHRHHRRCHPPAAAFSKSTLPKDGKYASIKFEIE